MWEDDMTSSERLMEVDSSLFLELIFKERERERQRETESQKYKGSYIEKSWKAWKADEYFGCFQDKNFLKGKV